MQSQQVILNLVMNGIESMRDVMDRARRLVIRSRPVESSQVLLAVEDSGFGLDKQSLEPVFEAVLHDQARRDGDGTLNQPIDRRGARRPALGGGK